MSEDTGGPIDTGPSPAVLAQLAPRIAAKDALPAHDLKMAQWIWGLYQEAKRWKMTTPYMEAAKNRDYWMGKQWGYPRAEGFAMKVANMVYESVETFNGHMMDSLQESVARARRPDQQETAQLVSKLLNWSDDINANKRYMDLVCRSAQVTGFGCRRIDWSTSMDGNRGAPRYSYVNSAHFFTSPWCRRLDEAEYVVEARNVPGAYVRKVWERGRFVPSGVWDGSLTPLSMTMGYGASDDYAAFTYGANTQITQGTTRTDSGKDAVTLIDLWVRRDDGQLNHFVCANGVILKGYGDDDDKGDACPLSEYDDDRFPYALYNVIPDENSCYGWPSVTFFRDLNTALNEMLSYEIDAQKYESDSPLVVKAANAEEAKTWDNRPGAVFTDADPNGQGVYLLQRTGANGRYGEMQERFVQFIRSIGGNVDILRGEKPAGVTTLGGMEIVREQANVLVAKMGVHINEGEREKNILTISRLRQFLHDQRWVRITKPGGREEHVEVNEVVEYDESGAEVLKNAIPDDFEADVDFTPAPPGGMQARKELAFELYDREIADAEYVMEELEIDKAKAENLLRRRNERAQAEAAAANPQLAAQEAQTADPRELAAQVLGMFGG